MINTALINPADFFKIGLMAILFMVLLRFIGQRLSIPQTPAA